MAIGTGAAILGGAIIGGGMSLMGSKRSADAIEGGAELSSATQLQMFREGQQQTAPWREAGKEALGALGDIYGIRTPLEIDQETGDVTEWQDPSRSRAMSRFETSPGYQFQLDEAMKASNFMSGGMSMSGPQARRLQEIAQGTANLEFGKYTQGLQSLAGVGQSSAESGASRGMSVGQSVGQNYMSAGAASAQDSINQANIMSNVIGQGAQAYGMYKGGYFNQPQQAGGAGYNMGGGSGMPAFDAAGYA